MKSNKAVAIAKDVIAQIKSHQYIATKGTYFQDAVDPDSLAFKAKELLNRKCNVCALGACIISTARLYNGSSYNAETDFDSISKELKKYFNKQDILLLEYIFEKGTAGELEYLDNHYSSEVKFSQKELQAAKLYGKAYKDNEDRLITIMCNIIRNKGRLVIPRKYMREAKKQNEA